VTSGPRPVVVIDTLSFRTSSPSEPAAFPWKPVAGSGAAALAAVGALFLVLARRRRQRPALVH
jgi:hypothetical protein